MVYHGTNMTETIWFGSASNLEDMHCIELIKADDESVFYVTTCCNDDWVWAFWMDSMSNYEVVKYTIMDAAFQCKDMNELIAVLDEVFAENFADIVADNEEEECNRNCCENCNHRGCLN